MGKNWNIYFENIENIVNNANKKNNVLICLTLQMDRSLQVEPTSQIHFENTLDEDIDET